ARTRPRGGRGGVVRPGPGHLGAAASDVLADPQSDHPQPPGLRLRQPVPLGGLLPRRRPAESRDRRTRRRAAIAAAADRHADHPGVGVLPGRGGPPARHGKARPDQLRGYRPVAGRWWRRRRRPAGYAAYPVALSTTIRTTTRTAPGRSSPGSLPSYFQDSWVSRRRPTSGVIDTRPRSST